MNWEQRSGKVQGAGGREQRARGKELVTDG